MTEDNHDWIPIAWWDETTKSVRMMFSYEKEIARYLQRTGKLQFLIDEAEQAFRKKVKRS